MARLHDLHDCICAFVFAPPIPANELIRNSLRRSFSDHSRPTPNSLWNDDSTNTTWLSCKNVSIKTISTKPTSQKKNKQTNNLPAIPNKAVQSSSVFSFISLAANKPTNTKPNRRQFFQVSSATSSRAHKFVHKLRHAARCPKTRRSIIGPERERDRECERGAR